MTGAGIRTEIDIAAPFACRNVLFSALFLRTETLSAKAVAGVLLAIAGVAIILTA